MAEHSAVNRRVVSSSLTCGANSRKDAPQKKGVLLVFGWSYVLGVRTRKSEKFYIGQTEDLVMDLRKLGLSIPFLSAKLRHDHKTFDLLIGNIPIPTRRICAKASTALLALVHQNYGRYTGGHIAS
jgi:hypothetical protein